MTYVDLPNQPAPCGDIAASIAYSFDTDEYRTRLTVAGIACPGADCYAGTIVGIRRLADAMIRAASAVASLR